MTRREIVELILSDMRAKLDSEVESLIIGRGGALTSADKESILAVQKVLVLHNRAYESMYKLLVAAHTHDVTFNKSKNNVDIIISKIQGLERNGLAHKELSRFYKDISELELSIYSLESHNLIKVI